MVSVVYCSMGKVRRHLKTGDKINRLEVLRLDHKNAHYSTFFLFKCDCGNTKVIKGSNVITGAIKSCGCLKRELGSNAAKNLAKTFRRLPNNRAVINAIILQYRKGAERRGFSFCLSYDEFTEIIQRDCFYCGLPPSNKKRINAWPDGYIYSGIDRVDPKEGYRSDNVVPCCIECNRAKGRYPPARFRAWIARLVAHATNPTT